MVSAKKIAVYISAALLVIIVASFGWYLILLQKKDVKGFTLSDQDQILLGQLRLNKIIDLNTKLKSETRYEISNPNSDSIRNIPEFVSFSDDQAIIKPSKLSHIGNHEFLIQTNQINHIFRINVSDKTEIFENLESILKEKTSPYEGRISLYVYDLQRKKGVGINENEVFIPASLTKLSYALLALRDVDQGKLSLDQLIPIRFSLKAYPSDSMYYFSNFRSYPLRLYLEMLIQESDNTAMNHLENLLGGYDVVKARIQNELGVSDFYRSPSVGRAVDINFVLKNIYSQSYLQPNTNEYLLAIMTNTNSKFHDRIKAGINGLENVRVAHKIGNLKSDNGLAINDAGIVYGEMTDFSLVIMTKDMPNSILPAQLIADLTTTIYNELN